MADDGKAQQGKAPAGSINPGGGPVASGTEAEAWANVAELVREVGERLLQVKVGRELNNDGPRIQATAGRDPALDDGGRYGYRFEGHGTVVRVLMPGLPLEVLQTASAATPCVRVEDLYWWWTDAVGQVAGALRGPNNLGLRTEGRQPTSTSGSTA